MWNTAVKIGSVVVKGLLGECGSREWGEWENCLEPLCVVSGRESKVCNQESQIYVCF